MTVFLKNIKYPLTWLVSVVVVVLSTVPVPEVPELEDVPFFDKWVHFVMYASLSVAIWMDRRLICRRVMRPLLWVFLFVYPSVMGGLMELVQAYLTTCRSGDWVDFYADMFGALLGLIVCASVDRWVVSKHFDRT